MKYHFKCWYSAVFFESPTSIYTLGAIVKATNLDNARRNLEERVRIYLEKNPDSRERGSRKMERISRYDIVNREILKWIRGYIEDDGL